MYVFIFLKKVSMDSLVMRGWIARISFLCSGIGKASLIIRLEASFLI